MPLDFKQAFQAKLNANERSYEIAGMVGKDETVYPLGSDTKVLSTIFELFTRPLMLELAADHDLQLIEPSSQNHYPDFTLCRNKDDKKKIAVDVKTTYVTKAGEKFGYTLGGYTSFIRAGKESKNIVFPFGDYSEHWVIGFVYERIAAKQAAKHATFTIDQVAQIPLPYREVRVFVQEKWRIASDKAGSGNTTNMGSISGTLQDFKDGKGPFTDEDEFLDYWRNYATTKALRTDYSDIAGYRKWKQASLATRPVQLEEGTALLLDS
jgi:ribosomal protein L20A (L18A)